MLVAMVYASGGGGLGDKPKTKSSVFLALNLSNMQAHYCYIVPSLLNVLY